MIHVTPNPNGSGWAVKRSDRARATSTHRTKDAAERSGRRMARRIAYDHPHTPVELVVHRRDGQIHRKHSMGHDPRTIRG